MVPVPRRRRSATGPLSALQRKPMKRKRVVRREEHDGLPLSDEAVLLVLSRLSSGDAGDLVRCAATCRRWRRLVSTDAAFICRRRRRLDPSPRRVRFFEPNEIDAAAVASRAPRFLRLGQPSLAGLVDGDGRWVFGEASTRVVTSSCDGGHLVVEVRRGKSGRALNLCVCNPVTGDANALPCLRGRDSPRAYACALLTAEHRRDDGKAAAAAYVLVIVYNRRSFMAARCFSSETGSWGQEARVTGARIGRGRLQHAAASHAVVHRGVVFWPRLRFALLTLPPMTPRSEEAAAVRGMATPAIYDVETNLLGLSRTGRLSVRYRSHNGDMFCVGDGTLKGNWLPIDQTINLAWSIPELSAGSVKLRRFCPMSSTVLFTAKTRTSNGTDEEEEGWFMLNLGTEEVEDVTSTGGDLSGDMYAYEMDLVTFLGTL